MKTSTAAFLGASAIAVVAAVSGAAFYGNTVIPEHLAAELNTSFGNAYDSGKLSDDIKVTRSGDITVKQAGFLKYVATIPSVTVTAEVNGVSTDIVVQSADYNVTITDKAETLAAAIAGEAGVEHGLDMSVDLQSINPVIFTTTFAPTEEGYNDVKATLNGSCEIVNGSAVLAGGQYGLKVAGENCALDGELADKRGNGKVTFTSDLTFQSQIANDGNDIFAGNEKITLTDMKIVGSSRGRPQGGITIEQMDIGTSYDGKVAATGANLGDLSSLFKVFPENVQFDLDVKGLEIQGLFPMGSPNISFGGSLGVQGTHQDEATIDTRFSYDVKGMETAAGMFVPGASTTPSAASCEATLGNVPMKKLSSILSEVADATGGTVTPDQLLVFSEDSLLKAMQEAGVSMKLNCEASNGEMYKSLITADHKIDGDAFPGDGKLELYGYEQAIEALAEIMGPYQVLPLHNIFKPLAQPTEDGKGLQWEYSLSADGVLTINGTKLGPDGTPLVEEEAVLDQPAIPGTPAPAPAPH